MHCDCSFIENEIDFHIQSPKSRLYTNVDILEVRFNI